MRTRSLFALLAAGTIALAACGSDNSSSSSNAPAAAATTAAAAAPTTAAAAAAAPTTTAASSATTDSDNSSYGNAYAVPTTAAASGGAAAAGTVSVTLADSKLGKIVVDANGMTLYAFLKDTGGTSVCSGGCANAWPPAAATGTPTAGTGITGALTTVARPDGSMQLKLGDWPLYRFAGDAAAGDTNGQGSGSTWYVVGADGQPIK
jgi:predicted lipoprotein with Yx(FWY)xxD motif